MNNKIKTFKKNKLYTLIIIVTSVFMLSETAHAECVYSENNFHIKNNPNQILIPIHRLFNTQNGANLYTKGVNDANYVLGKYPRFEFTDGFPAFCASPSQQENLAPIYRLYNTITGMHVYTRGEIERDLILNKWPVFEFTDGVPAFYASLSMQEGLTPLFRLYNKDTGAHVYTRGEIERDFILNKWSAFEFTDGVPAFYIHITNDPGPQLIEYQGPMISVGIWNAQRADVRTNPFKINSDTPYQIKNSSGTVIAQIPGDVSTTIKYNNGGLEVSTSSLNTISVGSETIFESQDGSNTSMIFDLSGSDFRSFSSVHPNNSQYRGSFKFKYRETSDSSGEVWAINILPMEQYVWGMGEITGTGPMEYNKIMTTSFRTYAYFWLYESTLNLSRGFIVNATPGNQLYKGYDYEVTYPRIKEAAQITRGYILTHPQSIFKDKVAITPYSSWTDGRTRSFQERWGSTNYPWCKSVPDPYGKNPTMTTLQLENGCCPASDLQCQKDYPSRQTNCAVQYQYYSGGNHMVGLSANGALKLAGTDYNWSWDRILKYYFTGTSLSQLY